MPNAPAVQLDLGVSDVHAASALPMPAGGYNNAQADHGKQEASLAIVRDQKGRVLTVTRPEPPHEYAIPGGLVEAGEQADFAAARELAEECGVTCQSLRHLCDITSPVDGRVVHVYRAETWTGEPHAAEPGTKVQWLMPNDLLSQAKTYRTSVRAIMDAGGLDMPRRSPRQASDRTRRTMAELPTKTRNALPDSAFALPSQRKYPVHDKSHTQNAAARLAQAKKKGKISDGDYATAHAAIARAEKRFGIKSGESETATDRPRRHHFAISADLAHGGSLHITHAALASMTDAGGVAYMPPRPIALTEDK